MKDDILDTHVKVVLTHEDYMAYGTDGVKRVGVRVHINEGKPTDEIITEFKDNEVSYTGRDINFYIKKGTIFSLGELFDADIKYKYVNLDGTITPCDVTHEKVYSNYRYIGVRYGLTWSSDCGRQTDYLAPKNLTPYYAKLKGVTIDNPPVVINHDDKQNQIIAKHRSLIVLFDNDTPTSAFLMCDKCCMDIDVEQYIDNDNIELIPLEFK